jgi:hypothetical protein
VPIRRVGDCGSDKASGRFVPYKFLVSRRMIIVLDGPYKPKLFMAIEATSIQSQRNQTECVQEEDYLTRTDQPNHIFLASRAEDIIIDCEIFY